MGIYICKLFSLNSKSKSGLEKMKAIQISPVITSREMVQLTGEQRVFIVLSYTRTLSTTEVRNAFQARFPDRNPPTHPSTILENVRKYQNAGTSLNLNKGNSGRRRTRKYRCC